MVALPIMGATATTDITDTTGMTTRQYAYESRYDGCDVLPPPRTGQGFFPLTRVTERSLLSKPLCSGHLLSSG
ncbi:hypothetical protein CNECB9_4370025 [Cupriavidus necator]|uniref:Uncharacterized protein n=1 Tax=Cupriavidus necator TaxID=106590 RepID=A0A1K0ILF6_CUPNE|nr:hypothetical protein CNECB9_4370025 [Cupriavidus necator]